MPSDSKYMRKVYLEALEKQLTAQPVRVCENILTGYENELQSMAKALGDMAVALDEARQSVAVVMAVMKEKSASRIVAP